MTKCRYFMTATELTVFVNNVANGVSTIVAITFDAGSGKFVLFYN